MADRPRTENAARDPTAHDPSRAEDPAFTSVDDLPRLHGTLGLLVENEVEGVLQSLFAARQDLLECLAGGATPELLPSAEATLHGSIATLKLLLGLLRTSHASREATASLVSRLSGPFCVLSLDGDVLYMNSAVVSGGGRDTATVTSTPFGERDWADRPQMRSHLDVARDTGIAEEELAVVRGDGQQVRMRLRTERLGEGPEAVLLMTERPLDDASAPPQRPHAAGARGAADGPADTAAAAD